jgi:hypothetical protein
VRDQEAVVDQRAPQAAVEERLPVRSAPALDLSIEDPVAPEDVAAGVAERRRFDRRGRQWSCSDPDPGGRVESAWVADLEPRIRCQAPPIVFRKKNGTDSTAASRAWRMRLPEPGSM